MWHKISNKHPRWSRWKPNKILLVMTKSGAVYGYIKAKHSQESFNKIIKRASVQWCYSTATPPREE